MAAVGLLEFGAQLDLGVLVDMDDPLRVRGNNGEADLGERVGRRIEKSAHLRRHVLNGLLPCSGDEVARDQRFAEEVALAGPALGPCSRISRDCWARRRHGWRGETGRRR